MLIWPNTVSGTVYVQQLNNVLGIETKKKLELWIGDNYLYFVKSFLQ